MACDAPSSFSVVQSCVCVSHNNNQFHMYTDSGKCTHKHKDRACALIRTAYKCTVLIYLGTCAIYRMHECLYTEYVRLRAMLIDGGTVLY